MFFFNTKLKNAKRLAVRIMNPDTMHETDMISAVVKKAVRETEAVTSPGSLFHRGAPNRTELA